MDQHDISNKYKVTNFQTLHPLLPAQSHISRQPPLPWSLQRNAGRLPQDPASLSLVAGPKKPNTLIDH